MSNTQSTAVPAAESRRPEQDPQQMRRVLFSSFLGSAVEFYDFLLYGTAAALVFGQLFFSDLTPVVATIASFGTLAVGYIVRPLGGVIFGHFGDRIGRKSMLVLTMSIMGAASFAIGLLPTYATIGVLAPILLIILRLIQGFAVGGEWGGAALMALEHSDEKHRGFSASFANMGAPAGAVLSTIVLAIVTLLPGDAFLSWGWRIPFLLSRRTRRHRPLRPAEGHRIPAVRAGGHHRQCPIRRSGCRSSTCCATTRRPCCSASAPDSVPSPCRP